MYSPLKPGLTLSGVRRTRWSALVPKHWARHVARMVDEWMEVRNQAGRGSRHKDALRTAAAVHPQLGAALAAVSPWWQSRRKCVN